MTDQIKVYGWDSTTKTFRPLPMSNGSIVVAVTIPQPTLNKILSVTTAIVGANFTAFPSYACTNLLITNYTDLAFDFLRGGVGDYLTIPALQSYNFTGLTNANQISIRRNDESNTPATLNSEAYTIA